MPDRLFVTALGVCLLLGMFLLGTQLSRDDLREAVAKPRAIATGLFCQLVVLPALAVAFVLFYPVSAPLKVGMIIVASTPGGPASNTITFLGKGNLPLAIMLTIGTSFVAVVTIPLYVNAGLGLLQYDRVAHLPVLPTILRSVLLILLPVTLGFILQLKKPALATRLERPTKAFTALAIVLLLSFGVYKDWAVFRDNFTLPVVGGAFGFGLMLLFTAFYLGRLVGVSPRDRYTVSIEAVVHNAVLSLLVVELVGVRQGIVFAAYFGSLSLAMGAVGSFVLRPGGLLNRTPAAQTGEGAVPSLSGT